MVAVTQQHLDQLAALVSQYSMAGVVEALAHVADQASVRAQGRDPEGEREWNRTAKELDRAAGRIAT
jgi:hypothetical protein